jgi:hypothetical protein
MRYLQGRFAVLALGFCLVASAAKAWEPVANQLMTRWSRDVSPENVLPEYPRPQMVRESWVNLNGLWQYAIRPAAEDKPEKWDGEILVPFAVESALSGVKKAVQPDERLWYRRTFESPSKDSQRLLLHFGAVDWQCTVWVNGTRVGEHAGGYVPFTFDITDAIRVGQAVPDAESQTKRQAQPDLRGENELVVAVSDPTDTGTQPRGKQVLKPHGIMYTAVTGIWQTVWLEPIPARHIESLKIVPDVDRGAVLVTVSAPGRGAVRVTVVDYDGSVIEVNGIAGETLQLGLKDLVLWTPDNPYLYDMRVELLDRSHAVDSVASYFGMRKIEIKKDAKGVNRLWLNNEVVFQYGPLDQGWWPDGLYTAPTDDALKYDIEMTKQLGMNMARKHVKVEPARWYYWCDKLGLLVWQDMPSGDVDKTPESKADFRRELQEMIDALHHFPSIVMWVPFNEGWGQHDTEVTAAWVKKYDPSRLVNESSGWHDKGSGDATDMHNYPGPGMREPESNRVSVLGEFGGLGMPLRGHTWQDEKNWGYVSYDNKEELTDAYVDLLAAMRPLIGRGLSAAVYTQTTDVEIEVNGLMTYDRALVKMDEPRIVAAAKKLYLPPPEVRVLVPTSEQEPQTWRYTTAKPADGWQQADFDDSGWKSGPGGFGAGEVRGAVTRTAWNTPDIWLRRSFELNDLHAGGQLMLNTLHDEDAEVYINGTLVRSYKRFIKSYQLAQLDDARKLLRNGRNTIAVHCRQTSGGQYIDVGLVQTIE